MKKLQLFAFALVAAFGFSACNEDPVEGVDYELTEKSAVFVGAGSNATIGSYVNSDGQVYKAADIKEYGSTKIIFVGNVEDGVASVYSGTDKACKNGYVNGTYATEGKGVNDEPWDSKASETKFANIKKKKADPETIYNMKVEDFVGTNVAVEAGDYVAFYNETLDLKGWLLISAVSSNDVETSGITLDYTIVKLK